MFNNKYRNRKVLVTGHTGFKGSWLTLWLVELGAKVIGYSLDPPTNPSLFDILNLKSRINHVVGDVRDGAKLKETFVEFKPEIVFHLAAQPLVRTSYLEPQLTYETNIIGTVNLYEAVRSTPEVRAIVNVTSDKCYDNKEISVGYREEDPLGGYDPYSSSKGCSEIVTTAYRSSYFNPLMHGKNHNVALASARAGNVIGGGDWALDRLIPDCIKSILDNKEIVIRNPAAIRPWQHVLEPLSGYILLGQKLFECGPRYAEAWNFGPHDKDAVPVKSIVKMLCEKWGSAASYKIDDGNHPHEAHYLKLNCSKARTQLGWKPRWGLNTAIAKVVEWFSQYKAGRDPVGVCLSQIKEYGEC